MVGLREQGYKARQRYSDVKAIAVFILLATSAAANSIGIIGGGVIDNKGDCMGMSVCLNHCKQADDSASGYHSQSFIDLLLHPCKAVRSARSHGRNSINRHSFNDNLA